MKLSISLLSIKNRLEFIKKINDYDIDYIHIDVMDNTFTNNVAYSIEEINEINKISNKKLDIHLMVNDPIKYINSFNNMNIEYRKILEKRLKKGIANNKFVIYLQPKL